MREAWGNPKLSPVGSRQLSSEMTSKRRRTQPDIDAHVKDRASHASYEFTLGARGQLEVQAAQHTLLDRMHVVILDKERSIGTVFSKKLRSERLGKKSAVISVFMRSYQEQPGEWCPFKLQNVGPTFRGSLSRNLILRGAWPWMNPKDVLPTTCLRIDERRRASPI